MVLIIVLLLFSLDKIVITSALLSKSECVPSNQTSPNYYWRKYEGTIPEDAVAGGHTPSGEAIYIGQILVVNSKHNALLPASIYFGKEAAEAAFFGIYKSNKYVAILCSSAPSTLQWRQVNEYELPLVDHLVVGGYETNQPAYIGRTNHDGHLIIGKVFTQRIPGLRIPAPSGKEVYLSSFEVLVYDPTN